MPVFKDHSFRLGASSDQTVPAYDIPQSIRFAYGDGPYLSKAFSSAGSKTFSLSWWTKLGSRTLDASEESAMFFIAYHSSGYQTDFSIQSSARASGVSHTFRTYSVNASGGAVWNYATNRFFQDPTAWYHFVVVSDTDNGLATDRFRLYINGVRETSFGTATTPGSGVTPVWGGSTSTTHYIGSRGNTTNTRFDGYMAEMIYADGYAYGPEYFGKFDSFDNWIPIDYDTTTGNYGTNGFKIDGSDASNLGKNVATGNTYASFASSGLGTHDQMIDTPTNNFATLNPLATDADFEFTQGNLIGDFNNHNTWNDGMGGTIGLSSGKWYWEVRWTGGNYYSIFGVIATNRQHMLDGSGSTIYNDKFNGFQNRSSGTQFDRYREVQSTDLVSGNFAVNDILQFALDMDNKKLWFGVNGTYQLSGDPSAGSNEIIGSSDLVSSSYTPAFLGYDISADTIIHVNFGQDGTFAGTVSAGNNSDANGIGNFKYTVPTGFLAICTRNLFTD